MKKQQLNTEEITEIKIYEEKIEHELFYGRFNYGSFIYKKEIDNYFFETNEIKEVFDYYNKYLKSDFIDVAIIRLNDIDKVINKYVNKLETIYISSLNHHFEISTAYRLSLYLNKLVNILNNALYK